MSSRDIAREAGEIRERSGALLDFLEPVCAERNIFLDDEQLAALERLQLLYDELLSFRDARQSTLRRLLDPPDLPRGMYLHGGVGRGKSFLMDAFFASLPFKRKLRTHFHSFMRSVHSELQALKNEEDPLVTVAQNIAKKYRLICFDEFHVSDVADAMILGRLLTGMFSGGVVLVMTSNYRPDDLYPNGLQRDKLLPTIALLKHRLDIVEVDWGTDYRLRALETISTYYAPLSPEAERSLERAFDRMRTTPEEDPRLLVENRELNARRAAGGLAWFDFDVLCDGPRSQNDYLEIARRFHTVILSGVPRMSREQSDVARRFTWLVDILYDHRVKLLMSAETQPAELYVSGYNSQEFPRTSSRMIEMQTKDYMAQAHDPR